MYEQYNAEKVKINDDKLQLASEIPLVEP